MAEPELQYALENVRSLASREILPLEFSSQEFADMTRLVTQLPHLVHDFNKND